MKKQYESKCECGKMIIGFSEHHSKENLKIHQLSNEHRERMKIFFAYEKIDLSKMNQQQIGDLLESHPLIIADIRDIGRHNK